MSAPNTVQRATLWALGLLERYRYIKFGIVGASGTVVTLLVLTSGGTWQPDRSRLQQTYFSWRWPSPGHAEQLTGTGCGRGPAGCVPRAGESTQRFACWA